MPIAGIELAVRGSLELLTVSGPPGAGIFRGDGSERRGRGFAGLLTQHESDDQIIYHWRSVHVQTGPVSQTTAAPSAGNNRQKLLELFRSRQISDEELMVNLALFMRSGALARLLFINELYQKIVDLPGAVMEFGIWWGQNLVLFENLRAVYEPYNHARRIVGFDTFTGYEGIGDADTRSSTISEGVYAVPGGYEGYLSELMEYHRQENVLPHIRKYDLIKGDAGQTSKAYFNDNPEVLVALAFFDMALYEPTKKALEAIRPRLVPGSVIAFDELNNHDYPGETRAALEVLNLRDFTVHRSRFLPDRTYFTLR
jgi:hypothetical protein